MARLLSHFRSIKAHIVDAGRRVMRKVLLSYFNKKLRGKKFCIISNDCWGGEIYKILNRPFNTPFIGLMIMSPCYLKLLENPQFYLNLPLVFKKSSKYPAMQKINAGVSYPLGVLGKSEVEIHFLHYPSEEIAAEKWKKRIKRIDWENLFIKYDYGKDYADRQSVNSFFELPYSNKLAFGKENFGRKDVYVLMNYSVDAVVQFKNCFLSFNPFGWLLGSAEIKKGLEELICKISNRIL